MITQTKLRATLAQLERKPGGAGHGKPMGGLSIPAEYYFGKRAIRNTGAMALRRRRPAKGVAAK